MRVFFVVSGVVAWGLIVWGTALVLADVVAYHGAITWDWR